MIVTHAFFYMNCSFLTPFRWNRNNFSWLLNSTDSSGVAVGWNRIFPYKPPIISISFLDLGISFGSYLTQRNTRRLRSPLPQHNAKFKAFRTASLQMNAAPSSQHFDTDDYPTLNSLKVSNWDSFVEITEKFHYNWPSVEFILKKVARIYLQTSKLVHRHLSTPSSTRYSPEIPNF